MTGLALYLASIALTLFATITAFGLTAVLVGLGVLVGSLAVYGVVSDLRRARAVR